MIPRKRGTDTGQALVEFALILIVLLLFIFIIIEAGRAFQSWLTLQNAARSAGRYAITGQFETDCLFVFPACLDPRVQSIKDEGRRASSGLPIDDEADVGLPQSFVTEVWSVDEDGTWLPDFAGGSADPIRVRVTYYMPFVTPLFRPIAEMVRLRGQVVVVAEDYDQLGTSQVQSSAPPIGNAGDTGDSGPTGGLPELDLELTKSASALNVQADSPLDYTLDVINHGPFDAENVTVVDTLPAGTTFLTGTVTGGGFCDPPNPSLEVTCFLPNLAGDGSILNSASVTLETRSPDAQGATINNTATVFNGTTALDTDLSNNTDSVTVTIRPPGADLAINITDSPPVLISSLLTYTLRVDNLGPDPATGVAVTVTLSSDLVLSAVPNGPCSKISTSTIRCNVPGNLPESGFYDFRFVVDTPASPGSITAIAEVAGNEVDPDLTNNTDSVVTTVASSLSDAFVQKSAPPGPLAVGVDFTYSIIAGNNGPDDIITLIVTDTLPPSVSVISQSSGCTLNGGIMVCTAPNPVPDNSSVAFNITVRPNVAEIISNEVVVGGDFIDPNPLANNFDVVDTVIGASDLEISKTGADFVLAGELLTYTLTITNNGPLTVTGVTIVDNLPANLGSVSVSPSMLCSVGGSQATCGPGGAYAQMLPGASLTAIVTGTAPAEDFIVNSATVSSVEADLDDSNNTAVLTSTTVLASDLEISKFAIPDLSATEGSVNANLIYFVQVVNKGPSDATGVVITDTLPAGVTFGSASPGCTNVGNLVTCDFGDLIVGPTVNATINVTPTVPSVITNTAEVTGVEVDLIGVNNTDSITTTIFPADLTIEKIAPATALVTDTFSYTILVTNNGPGSAVSVAVTDTLPVSITNPVPSASKGTCSSGSGLVICDVGNMVIGETISVTISVTPIDVGLAVNEVLVTAGGTDPSQTADDMDTAVTEILPVVDLRLSKEASHDPVTAGTNLTYTLVVTNEGPSDAYSVVISDTLIPELSFVGSVPNGACNESGGVATCNIGGGIAAGASGSVQLIVNVASSVPHGDRFVNAASVSSAAFESDPLSNRDTAESEVIRSADLRVTKSDEVDPAPAGGALTYIVEVENLGPSDASNVAVTDVLTDVLIFSSAGSSGECSASLQTVTCDNFDLAAGEMKNLIIVTTVDIGVPEGTILDNTASAAASEDDPDPTNNSGIEDTTVTLETDLAIDKSSFPNPVVAGTTLTYTLVVTNNGPSNSTGSSIDDSLHSALSGALYCEVTSGSSCIPGTIYTGTIGVGPLAVDESATFLIRSNVSPAQRNDMFNTATVTTQENDPIGSSNSDTEITSVSGVADVGIDKSGSPDPVLAGEPLTYTLVVNNNGPSRASVITVTDVLTDVLTFSAVDSSAECSASVPDPQAIDCLATNLDAGDTITFTVVATVSSSVVSGTTLANTASVSASEPDPVPGNNSTPIINVLVADLP